MIRHGLGQTIDHVKIRETFPFEKIRELIRAVRIICPENTFHREVLQGGGPQGQQGMGVVRDLSQGVSFSHGQTIEDFQVFRALQGFINGSRRIAYRKNWKDAFPRKSLSTIFNKRSSVAFRGGIFLASEANNDVNAGPQLSDIRLKIRYDQDAYFKERQLQKRFARHLRDLVRLGLRYRSVMEGGDRRHLDGFWMAQKTDLPLGLWSYCGGMPRSVEGLATFFESDAFSMIPTMKIKQQAWNVFPVAGRPGLPKMTRPADLTVLATVIPYADVMILGDHLARMIRDELRLGVEYDTEIYSVNEGDRLLDALIQVPGAD
jgi:hypothetical protein